MIKGCEDSCNASCCSCFLRSFWESLLADLVVAWSFTRCSERLIERFETLLDDVCAIISRMSNFDDESFGEDHLAVEVDGDSDLSFLILSLEFLEGYIDALLSKDPSTDGVEGTRDISFISEFEFDFKELELAGNKVSSSSISNIRSFADSLGRILGLKGAFRAAFDFLLGVSWPGEPENMSSTLWARNDVDRRLS